LDLNGKSSLIQTFEGGDIEASVVTVPMAQDYYSKKHLGNVKYNEFSIDVGMGGAPAIYDWIQTTLDGKAVRKSGALRIYDAEGRETEVREFQNALITEITIPAQDAASKDAGYLKVKFAPEVIRNRKGSGKIDNSLANSDQKKWTTSNFQIRIGDLNTARVKIDSFTIKQQRISTKEPSKIEFPNLRIQLPEEDAGLFKAWHEDFVIAGNNDDSKEKTGALTFLDPTSQKPLLEFTFSGLGIFKGTAEPAENNGDKIRRYAAEMYVERIAIGSYDANVAKIKATKSPSRMPASVTPNP